MICNLNTYPLFDQPVPKTFSLDQPPYKYYHLKKDNKLIFFFFFYKTHIVKTTKFLYFFHPNLFRELIFCQIKLKKIPRAK